MTNDTNKISDAEKEDLLAQGIIAQEAALIEGVPPIGKPTAMRHDTNPQLAGATIMAEYFDIIQQAWPKQKRLELSVDAGNLIDSDIANGIIPHDYLYYMRQLLIVYNGRLVLGNIPIIQATVNITVDEVGVRQYIFPSQRADSLRFVESIIVPIGLYASQNTVVGLSGELQIANPNALDGVALAAIIQGEFIRVPTTVGQGAAVPFATFAAANAALDATDF